MIYSTWISWFCGLCSDLGKHSTVCDLTTNLSNAILITFLFFKKAQLEYDNNSDRPI